MTYRIKVKAALCAASIFLCCFLGGCSLSFCGLTAGGKEELVFTCEEGLPEEKAEAPVRAELPEEKAEALEGSTQDGKVDLNTASLEQLMTLNGIGETRANAILEYRTKNGPFSKIEDIMQIPGIKEGIFSKIKDQITVH